MTKLELRILQLMSRAGGPVSMTHISNRTSRFESPERNLTMHQLEQQGMVSSAQQPVQGPGGRKGGSRLVYWLTPAGAEWVAAARARGEIKDRVAV